ncbi:hypothetical protein ACSS6W_008656 [Trichoderma asperelloides]
MVVVKIMKTLDLFIVCRILIAMRIEIHMKVCEMKGGQMETDVINLEYLNNNKIISWIGKTMDSRNRTVLRSELPCGWPG